MGMKLPFYETNLGKAYCSDCLELMNNMAPETVDLVITSPPYALRKKKSYGNVSADKYCDWFMPYAKAIHRLLKPSGSFVLDIGGAWNKGQPTRALYHFKLLLRLCDDSTLFNLAQEFYWYNPAKLPAPAQWVTIERIRVKDAVNPIWWLSKTPRPKSSNLRVLKPYTKSMEYLLSKGYTDGKRPSGHIISKNWGKRQEGAIPPNIIIAANTKSTDKYIKACKRYGLEVHPARFVEAIPEFFIKFLTEPKDLVLDPFSGSNVVGEVSEKLERKWISIEINEDYVIGSSFRFDGPGITIYRDQMDKNPLNERRR